MSGQRIVGEQLPSTNEMALQLSASPYTIHTALTKLVKEGWLERLNGTGTYVVDPGKRFVRAGIYYAVDICSNEHPAFIRNVHASLLEKFKKRGKETHIFMDTRPIEQQVKLLPALEKALQERTSNAWSRPPSAPTARLRCSGSRFRRLSSGFRKARTRSTPTWRTSLRKASAILPPKAAIPSG